MSASELTQDEELARMRAAVAEAGYSPDAIHPPENPGFAYAYDPDIIPADVAWKAGQVATSDVGEHICCRCHVADARVNRKVSKCAADRLFMDDCGVDRP